MRVVGYVRDSPEPGEAEPAFAQAERIRRWVADNGHQLVSLCQDVRTPGRDLGRDGYKALVGVVGSGDVDGVVVPDLATLSADKVTQEVMLWELRSGGMAVLSTDAADHKSLLDPPAEEIRLIVRDVLAKVSEHLRELNGHDRQPLDGSMIRTAEATAATQEGSAESDDVLIELVPADSPVSEPISPTN